MNTYLKLDTAMKSMITIGLLLLSMLLMSSSCDKNVNEILDNETNEITEPLKVDLQGVETQMLQSDQAFAFDFFSKVFDEERNDKNGNFMVSPFSLSMALAMTWNGSEGDTRLSIQNTLGMGDWSDDEVNNYFKKLKEAFEKTDPSTELSIANAIWTNKDIKIFLDFISLNQSYYNATVEAVDFGNPGTVGKINQWAFNSTNGLIKEVISNTNPNDLMYLLNALYFKGIWTSEFEVKNTSKMDFTADDGTQTIVDMMQQETRYNYTDDEIMQLVELPYGNKAFSMMVLLPKKDVKLTDVTQALKSKDYWSDLTYKMSNKKVDLFLPKFKTAYSKKLNGVLIDMGMGIAFAPSEADFSRMSNRDAFISLVNQDTFIATDEMGTEAAAVTSVGVTVTSFPTTVDKIVFKADRPFIYIIQEKSTGSILFMGAVRKF